MDYTPHNKNARFTYNDVRITLKQGQSLNHYQAWLDDEGWSYSAQTFNYDGQCVTMETANGGRDCDGRVDYYADFILGNDGLFHYQDGSQRDQYAEIANY